MPPVPMDVFLFSGQGPVPGSDQWKECSGKGGWKIVHPRHRMLRGFLSLSTVQVDIRIVHIP